MFLTDDRLRRELTAPVRGDIALGPFWNWYDALSDAERQQVIAPVMNKVRPFLLRERVRHVLGQLEPRFDLASVFSQRKILDARMNFRVTPGGCPTGWLELDGEGWPLEVFSGVYTRYMDYRLLPEVKRAADPERALSQAERLQTSGAARHEVEI